MVSLLLWGQLFCVIGYEACQTVYPAPPIFTNGTMTNGNSFIRNFRLIQKIIILKSFNSVFCVPKIESDSIGLFDEEICETNIFSCR